MKNLSDNWEELRRKVLGLGDSSLHKTHYPSLRQRLAELDRFRVHLQKSEAYLSQAQRLSHTGSFGWKVSTGEIYWSEETYRIFQYDPTTKPTLDLVLQRVQPEDAGAWKRTIERESREGKDFDHEYRLLMPDGSVKHVRVVARPQRDASGELEFVGAVMDVTAAKETEERIRLIIDTVPGLLWRARPDGWIDFINKRWLNYTGMTLEQGLGWGWQPAFHPDDLEQTKIKWRAALAEGKPFEAESRIRRFDGEYRWFLGRAFPLLDHAGQILAWYGSNTDIHDRKQAEEKLRKDETYLHEAQRLGRMGFLATHGSSGAVIAASPELLRIFGFDPDKEKATGEMFRQRVHPDDLPSLLETANKARREKSDYEVDFRIVLPDGSVRHAHSVAHAVIDDSGGLVEFIGTTVDVTEHHRMTRKLKLDEFYLSAGERLSHGGSWSFTSDGICDYWSPERFAIFGFEPSKGIPTIADYLARVHPDDRALVKGTIDKMIAERAGSDITYRIVHPERGLRFVRSVCEASLDEGNVTRFVGTTLDITEQHQAREALEKALDEINKLKDELYRENVALKEDIDQASMFEEIVGSSESLREVLVNIVQVAPTVSTVLITGETGTGKELVARAIHKRSRRAGRPFVRVNCAAIAPSLIASELFGHERGAFTGAVQRRQGRFELAEGGTLFLDEIGDLPEETQLALLRVLQEREFERVGGSQTVPVDVRVIASTNRDLEAAMNEGKFRRDLFYRLNVFPIVTPPLRQRREDIPSLVQAFVRELSRSMGKTVNSVPQATMEALQRYDWPGNIRELRNVIERGMILSRGNVLHVELPTNGVSTAEIPSAPEQGLDVSLEEVERRHIMTVLDRAGWKIAGKDGAASRLGMSRTTLQGRMRKLGIFRPQ
jgi:PAS domain S-box-containing protein